MSEPQPTTDEAEAAALVQSFVDALSAMQQQLQQLGQDIARISKTLDHQNQRIIKLEQHIEKLERRTQRKGR